MVEKIQIGRIAFRQEGEMWNAYYAEPNTMKDALWLGSLAMKFASNPIHKRAFMDLMRAAVGDTLSDIIGGKTEWRDPVMAPEHERGGNS